MHPRSWVALCSIALGTFACSNSNGGGGGSGGAGGTSGEAGLAGWPVQFGTESTYVNGVATDAQGNVYVAGYAGLLEDAGDEDSSFVAKYDPSGARVWLTEVDNRDFGAIARDATSGSIYVAASGVLVNGHGAAVLIKFDATGKQVWEQTLGATVPNLQAGGPAARALTVDSSGDVLVAGVSDVPVPGANPVMVGDGDLMLAKYDASGNLKWVTLLGSTESTTTSGISDYANAVTTDAQGNAYVAGVLFGTVGGQVSAGDVDMGVAKFDVDGNNVWVRAFGSPVEDEAQGVAVDASGNVYAAGYTLGDVDGHTSAGDHDVLVVKYDTDGNKQWSQQIGGSSSDVANGVALDAQGQPVIGGTSYGDFDGHTNQFSNGDTGD
ncbi:MAG TPA: SBBP repeat-containing protein, partial [Polyangiaceae bacterium]